MKLLINSANYKYLVSFIIFSFFFLNNCFSQADFTTTKTVRTMYITTDFGATNNGETDDDTWAFIKAGKYISNRWAANGAVLNSGTRNYNPDNERIRLIIPSGTYKVGKQLDRNSMSNCNNQTNISYQTIFNLPALSAGQNYASVTVYANSGRWLGLDLILLDNYSIGVEVEIVGETGINNSKPLIKYNPLHIGYFNCNGNGITVTGGNAFDGDIGHFVESIGYRNLLIKNVEIDGNNVPGTMPNLLTTEYGGNFLANGQNEGIQVGGDGILLTNTKNISIEDVYIHHMTREGIQVNDDYFLNDNNSTSRLNLLIKKTICDFNRRNAFSWGGGRGLKVEDSKFNNTGQTVINALNGPANTNPGAGIDIESLDNNANKRTMDATFTNCESYNNIGWALVNGPGWQKTRNVTFNNCKFHDVFGYCVVVRGNAITFNDCKIWGAIDDCNSTGIAGDETKFNNCDFQDVPIPGEDNVSMPGDLINSDGGLVSINLGGGLFVDENVSGKKTLFSNCTFTANNIKRLFFINVYTTSENDFLIFNSCTFNFPANYTQDNGALNQFYGCVFNGNNVITNNNLNNLVTINAKGIVFLGSSNPCSPNSFTLNKFTRLFYAKEHGGYSNEYTMGRNVIGGRANNGYFNFNIDNKSCLHNHYGTNLTIGNNSTLRNMNGGLFLLYRGSQALGQSIINLNGKMIFESGSYFKFVLDSGEPTNLIYITGSAGCEFYYHKNSTDGISPYYPISVYNLPALTSLQNLQLNSFVKFDGGNSSISNSTLRTSENEGLQFPGWIATTPLTSNPNANNNLQAIFPAAPSTFNWANINPFSIEISFRLLNGASFGTLFSQANGLGISFRPYILPLPSPPPTGYIPPQSTQLHLTYFNSTMEDYIDITISILPVFDNSCHYLTITRSNSDLKLRVYLDGNSTPVFIVDNPFPGYVLAPYNTMAMGGMLDGWINQVRLWSKALSNEEICYNYIRKKPINNTGLWTDWDMTENDGVASVFNGITTSINATLVGNVTRVSQNTIGNCLNVYGKSNSYNNFRPTIIKSSLNGQISSQNGFSVYPNPNNGMFEIKVKDFGDNQKLYIYNTAGKLVYSQILGSRNIHTINAFIFSNGIYIIKLISGKNIYTKKIIVAK